MDSDIANVRFVPWHAYEHRRVLQSAIDLPVPRKIKTLHAYWQQHQAAGSRPFLMLDRDQCLALIWLNRRQAASQVIQMTFDSPPDLPAGPWLANLLDWVYNEPLAGSFSPSEPDAKQPIYRLEWVLHPTQFGWLDRLRELGCQAHGPLTGYWHQPGSGRHESGWLVSLLSPEQPGLAVALIPFAMAVVAVRGSAQTIQAVDFLRYGVQPRQAAWQQTADYLQLLDTSGRLMPQVQWPAAAPGRPWYSRPRLPAAVETAADQLYDYLLRRRTSFDVPLDLSAGSPFQQKVWQTLRRIPYASTWNYEQLAGYVAQEGQLPRQLARAVGSACGANPIPIIVPCHRVIGKNGHLVGFSGGIDLKEYLLAHEMLGI